MEVGNAIRYAERWMAQRGVKRVARRAAVETPMPAACKLSRNDLQTVVEDGSTSEYVRGLAAELLEGLDSEQGSAQDQVSDDA